MEWKHFLTSVPVREEKAGSGCCSRMGGTAEDQEMEDLSKGKLVFTNDMKVEANATMASVWFPARSGHE